MRHKCLRTVLYNEYDSFHIEQNITYTYNAVTTLFLFLSFTRLLSANTPPGKMSLSCSDEQESISSLIKFDVFAQILKQKK